MAVTGMNLSTVNSAGFKAEVHKGCAASPYDAAYLITHAGLLISG